MTGDSGKVTFARKGTLARLFRDASAIFDWSSGVIDIK